MKMVEVYLSTAWLNENTQRQRFRDREVSDLVSASQKLLKAAPMVALAGAGFSKGMVNPSLTLMNISTHTVKEIHNGIANVGKNNGRFYEGIDSAKQPQMKKNAQSNYAGPLVKLWLVTDDDEASKATVGKGVLFHSQTEATRFRAMYSNLDEYLSSKFYKQKEIVTLRINESDFPLFEKELLHYLDARENSLRSELLVRPKLSPQNFALSRVYEEETGALIQGDDGEYLIEIDFPVAVGRRTLAKYFPETISASVKAELSLFSEAIVDLERFETLADELDVSEDDITSDLDSASQQSPEAEDEEFEGPPTAKGKEKAKRHDREEVNALKEDVTPKASDRVSARQLSHVGVFKHADDPRPSEADSELTSSHTRSGKG
ncbi:hypothetical protein DIZ81_06750 [Legionella taurinensis]|uniref:Uncharacterized protein n=1 Tax=Legionella taurinensis TaxID=70611 RepID=A0A3A5LF41_9GAMM|nr:hypothetical protein [Legionella taurinensis]MDX1837230.1 hypothetical protein [Legionella taurinensis]PUT40297.1 hypothetical protein DB744_06750 [Legionella taurinensis]PUT41531.1 hypothetical protein DB746_09260 [Legionella taurinensis]PUT44397.1 hypothetical protein DB743_08475 [Legionella taurinensis]PUT48359.1 hypothetical protein DB745_05150 [Legionella taurinensis]